MQPHIIDTRHLGHTGIIAATALETNDGVVLFDTGPESTFQNVAIGLERLGIDTGDVRHVFLSHIHFDHAGAAFRFAETGATIYVHPRGAPHLIDPSRLVESATRIFGSEMERLWGHIAPVPQTDVRVLTDAEIVRVGNVDIRAVETPGHASHHHVYHWNDAVFGGDVAGVRIGSGPPVPPFVPPELHIESWVASIEKIRALRPQTLYLPHFGRVIDSIDDHLDALRERVERWSMWFRDQIVSGKSDERMVAAFAEFEHE
ncbi:MAG TPA: MBL fold metallo-hydrolase, partial [Chthoniobacterales bacterium]|nr:MBL fold metallo-hydrolase [Chthoniobacterales bacterium]